MKDFATQTSRAASRLVMLALLLSALVALPLLSTAARTEGASITVTNNSSRNIRYIYLSPTHTDDWSENQLTDQTLNVGQSATVSVASCTGAQIKVIGEDTDGCFVSAVINCETNAAWTITNDAVPNCGN